MCQAWVDLQPADNDTEIVNAVAESDPPHFNHAQPAARRAVFGLHPLEQQHSMYDTPDRWLRNLIADIIEHERGALPLGEKLLHAQHFPAKPQWILGKQPQLREGIEHHARWLDFFDPPANLAHGIAEFHLSWMKYGVLRFRPELVLQLFQLIQLDSVERPSMGIGHELQLLRIFGKRNTECSFAYPPAFE